jgi:hypothetical protein
VQKGKEEHFGAEKYTRDANLYVCESHLWCGFDYWVVAAVARGEEGYEKLKM